MLEGSILHRLQQAHQSAAIGKRPLNFGVYYKNTLVALCHALEDCILTASSPPLVIAAFQRGKWYLQEADRYGAIADKASQVVILAAAETGFADHPTSQKAPVELVSLAASDPVAQEWHLMILSPTYAAMVLCQELSAADYGKAGVPSQDLERKFYGFWTFEASLVQETVDLAIAHIRPYHPDLADRLTGQMTAIQATQPTERDDPGEIVSRVVDYLQTQQHWVDGNGDAPDWHPDLLDNNLVSNEVQAFLRMAQLTDQADPVNPTAAAEVAALAETMGQLLDLPIWQLHRLKLAGLLHRLAPFQQTQSDLQPGQRYASINPEAAPHCPLIPGAQVLRRMPQIRAIATIITHQMEHWNGSGQPAGLAGDDIPLESRILGLVADFQHRLALLRQQMEVSGQPLSLNDALDSLLSNCRQDQGDRWDPKLVDTLALLVCGLKQGLSLPVGIPKISAGLWLVDSHCSEDLLTG